MKISCCRLRAYCDGKKPEFVLIGEMIHGDYNRITADGLLHSVTNYECYKGLYSAFNSMNLFEIAHSLGRQFGPEPWTLYRGKHLMNFADNHDVTRIASILNDESKFTRCTACCSPCRAFRACITEASGAQRAKSMRATRPAPVLRCTCRK